MRVVSALAWHTFLEAVRDKVLYLLLFFGIFVFGVSRLLSPLALGEGRRVTLDVGLASLSIFGCLITIFVGHQLIFREVERKTLYFLFSRPIRWADFVWGKYLGLLLTLVASVGTMGLLLALVLLASDYAFGWVFLQALGLIFLELSILAAVAVLLAAFTSPVLAGLFTLAAYMIGHGSGDLRLLLTASPSNALQATLTALWWIVPRLDLYGDTQPVLLGSPWPLAHCLFGISYAACYATACLLLAGVVLSRRQLAL